MLFRVLVFSVLLQIATILAQMSGFPKNVIDQAVPPQHRTAVYTCLIAAAVLFTFDCFAVESNRLKIEALKREIADLKREKHTGGH